MSATPHLLGLLFAMRRWINSAVDARWNNAPFGSKPHASKDEYLRWFEIARQTEAPPVSALEALTGFAVDREWLDGLALHTQIVKKASDLAYHHGRVLYTLMRRMISQRGLDHVAVVETGTARGFSAMCLAKAIDDSAADGVIVTIDVLSHLKRQIWNCIDDHDGPRSRAEILARWSKLLRKIVFLQGDTALLLPRVGFDRIHFAFLDAQHTEADVLREFSVICERQSAGDMIVFDDVTPELFPGVVKAVERIADEGRYRIERLAVSAQRGYAWAERL